MTWARMGHLHSSFSLSPHSPSQPRFFRTSQSVGISGMVGFLFGTLTGYRAIKDDLASLRHDHLETRIAKPDPAIMEQAGKSPDKGLKELFKPAALDERRKKSRDLLHAYMKKSLSSGVKFAVVVGTYQTAAFALERVLMGQFNHLLNPEKPAVNDKKVVVSPPAPSKVSSKNTTTAPLPPAQEQDKAAATSSSLPLSLQAPAQYHWWEPVMARTLSGSMTAGLFLAIPYARVTGGSKLQSLFVATVLGGVLGATDGGITVTKGWVKDAARVGAQSGAGNEAAAAASGNLSDLAADGLESGDVEVAAVALSLARNAQVASLIADMSQGKTHRNSKPSGDKP
jgi:hypothetical protein